MLTVARQAVGFTVPDPVKDPDRFAVLRTVGIRIGVDRADLVVPTIETYLATYHSQVFTTPLRTVVLVACSASKATRCCRAQDLYTGDLFTAAKAFIRAHRLSWMILSAKHLALDPHRVIAPYEQRVPSGKRKQAQPGSWSYQVAHRLACRLPSCHLLLLAGKDYRAPLSLWGTQFLRGFTWSCPLSGLGIGYQRQWLRQHSAADAEQISTIRHENGSAC